jgi:thiamine-monophosphate kinase
MISVTLLGSTAGGRCLTRSGARPGDIIAVSGTLGAASGGLELVRLPTDDPRRSAQTASVLIDALLRPIPRVALGQALLKMGASAAMDLSDGLLGDLPKLLQASDVDAVIDLGSLPIPAALRALFPDVCEELALRGGDDYELLFTAPEAAFSAIQSAALTIGHTTTPIGRIESKRQPHPTIRVGDGSGGLTTIQPGAFDHFPQSSK